MWCYVYSGDMQVHIEYVCAVVIRVDIYKCVSYCNDKILCVCFLEKEFLLKVANVCHCRFNCEVIVFALSLIILTCISHTLTSTSSSSYLRCPPPPLFHHVLLITLLLHHPFLLPLIFHPPSLLLRAPSLLTRGTTDRSTFSQSGMWC